MTIARNEVYIVWKNISLKFFLNNPSVAISNFLIFSSNYYELSMKKVWIKISKPRAVKIIIEI